MKIHSKKIADIIVLIVVLAGVFGGGYEIGVHNMSSSGTVATPSTAGIASSTAQSVDLAPLWKAWSILDANFVSASSTKKMDNQDKVWGAIEGLTASYGDPYTTFFPPEQLKRFEDDIQGNFEGVGIEITTKDGVLTVVSPLKGTPADKAGLRAKDQIIKIDGKSTMGMNSDDATKLIRGPKGSTVVFTVVRDGKELEIKVVRDVIDVPIVVTKLRDDGVFTIQITSFAANSADKFREALREFVKSGSDKMLIDLRGNPGGYLEAAVDIASWFLPADKVVVREDFGDKTKPEEVFKSKGYDVFTNKLKLVMLVDEGSASASEILAGALKEQGKATLVGTKTFGKGSVQELIPVTENSSLKVTIAHWFTPNGVSLSNNGVDPDVVVKMTDADRKAGRDPQLDKAVEILNSNQ